MKESYVEIDTNIIKNNVEVIIKKYNNYKYYIGVIKGNAYGHGFKIAKYMVESGINYLAVSTLKEALEVRKILSTPILCLQPIDINELKLASENNITITISSYEYYKEILDKPYNLKVHLKLDTGMNRLGINKTDEVTEIYNNLINNNHIKLEGIYTHLATLGVTDKKWDNQISKFKELTREIDLSKIEMVHLYSTNSLVMHPKLDFDNAVRIGILMYGVVPRNIKYVGIKGKLRKIKREYLVKKYNISKTYTEFNLDVHPALKLISKVVEIKDVKKDEYIGYGLKYKTLSDTKVAIVPIGYADGISLNSSGRYVLINNKKYRIVGSVNMKMLTILVDNEVKTNDKVIVIGDNVRYICSYTNTTPQNLFTTIPSNIERIYK